MNRVLKLWCLFLFAVAAILMGLKEDVDVCAYTSEKEVEVTFFGIVLGSEKYPGFRPWIENELGLTIASQFEDYSDTFPLLTLRSSLPGNWLFLRSAKSLYYEDPRSRTEIKRLIEAMTSRDPPMAELDDHEALNYLRDPDWNEIPK